jgi:AcrR family transcriptional regulator
MSQSNPLHASSAGGSVGRGRILQAAVRLFAQSGFNGVSISDVAASALVVKSAIYHHFSSKEALYLAVLDETCRLSSVQMAASAQGATWSERLRGAVLVLGRLVGPRSHVLSLILEGMAQTSPASFPADAAALAGLRREFTSVIAREIGAGIAAYDLNPIDPELASLCLIGLVTAALQASPDSSGDAQVSFALDLFLHGASSSKVSRISPGSSEFR